MPKKIRKRSLSSKEAFFAQDKYVRNAVPSGTVLNDQAICRFVTDEYKCNNNPTVSQITNFENSITDYSVSFPITAYNSNETTLVDQNIYIDSNNDSLDFTLAGTDEGTIGRFSIFNARDNLGPYSTMDWSSPMGSTNSIRCGVQIEIDSGGIIQYVDGRN